MGNKYSDFSELKKFKVEAPPAPPPPKPISEEDRALAGATDSTDYFSSLLGAGEAKKSKPKPAPSPRGVPQTRTTVVTPNTVARVREEQVAAKHEAIESGLREQIAVLEEANVSFAEDVATAKTELEDCRQQLAAAQRELAETRERAQAELAEARAQLQAANAESEAEAQRVAEAHAAECGKFQQRLQSKIDESAQLSAALAEREEENARLRKELAAGGGRPSFAKASEGTGASALSGGLLNGIEGFTEKFDGEVREHVLETLGDAFQAAEAAGRDRRARILEEMLSVNASSGELERRREAVKRIVKEAGHSLDNAAIAALEKLGFKYISGNKHHKLDWAGIRFPLAKTPSDYRSCLNSAAEISQRVF